MPPDLRGRNSISNLFPPTELDDKEFLAGSDNYVTSAGISGANDDDFSYLESHDNSTAIQDTTLNPSTIIKEVGNIFEVFNKGITELNSSRTIFTQDHDLDPAKLAGGKQPI